MTLKQDEDFLRFLTIGAAGTAGVLHALDRRHGHRVIELERYATANKIWETKIKRLRLADLVCLDCGIRVEVRTKSKLAIRMSHSDTPGREWDAGPRNEDMVAFVAWNPFEETVADHLELFQVSALRETRKYATLGARKAASEGAERDLTWPASVPKRDGVVETVDDAEGRVRYAPSAGRRHTYQLRRNVPAHIYVTEGQAVRGGQSFLLGCVPAPESVDCPGKTWSFVDELKSEDQIARYVAVKAAGVDGDAGEVESRLIQIAEDQGEDERVRLEARGSLARVAPTRHTDYLADYAGRHLDTGQPALTMESVFILSELGTKEAAQALAQIAANTDLGSETRSAAAWGLGRAGADEADLLLPFIADPDDEVAMHSLAGIGALDPAGIGVLRALLENGSDREATAAAVLLRDEGAEGLRVLLEIARGTSRSAIWAKSALGEAPESSVREVENGSLDPRLTDALSPMWAHRDSWLNQHAHESPLEFLQRQTVRHLG